MTIVDEQYIVGSYCMMCDERPSVEVCKKCGSDYCRSCFDRHECGQRTMPDQQDANRDPR